MKLPTKLTLVTVLVVAAIILFAILFNKPFLEPTFENIDIPKIYSIQNKTEYEFLSKVISAGITELGMDTVYITLYPLDEATKEKASIEGRDLFAHIVAGNVGTKQYAIFIAEDGLGIDDYITVIAHELIHLQQYESGKLRVIDLETGTVVYNGWPYQNISLIPYDNRPWEQEAFKESTALAKKITKRLYGSFN